MTATYQPPSTEERRATPKPAPGTSWKKSKETAADRRAHERKEMEAAKRRDGHTCRVPRCEHMPQKPRIEAAHKADSHRQVGGNPKGDRTERRKCLALCFIHHRAYDAHDLVIEPLDSEAIFDGPCVFYERVKGKLAHIGTESRIGVSTTRSLR